MLRSGLFLEEMLQLYPAETVDILSSNPAQAASLVSGLWATAGRHSGWYTL